METMVGTGPRLVSVYCARPPVVFGINAFNSDMDAMDIIFNMQAMIMAKIKTTPILPDPCPKETRQLVAITNPTETDTTFLTPSFFSSISTSDPHIGTDIKSVSASITSLYNLHR